MKVAVLGATGETGSSIVNGLLESTEPKYEITALVRPSSLQKPEVHDLEKRGIKIVGIDLSSSEEHVAPLLEDIDVLISSINTSQLTAQIPLTDAAKSAGVKRFVPCNFATVAPPKGVLSLRDLKEDVINHVKQSFLPYTIIDVGWWYQLTLPKLPSGRIDYALVGMPDVIVGEGNTPSAMTDLRDVGRYVTRIVADLRTLNKMVFAYSELATQNQVYNLLEELSGEIIERHNMSSDEVMAGVTRARAADMTPGTPAFYNLSKAQYWHSWGVRGDNTPEYALYLGYLNAKDLYPDLKGISLRTYCQEVLDGQGRRVYRK